MAERETELYPPVASFLTSLGYTVRSEVQGCDVAATRGDELAIVELKRVFNLELVFQGIARQRVTETVYVAIEEPRGRGRRRLRNILRLCRLLGLGLLTVRLPSRARKQAVPLPHGRGSEHGGAVGRVEVLLDPAPYTPRLDARRRAGLIAECRKRSADHNVGGSVRRKIVTAYREEALRLAFEIRQQGPSPVATLRESAESTKAQSILYNNFYGWFERVERGVYQLTPAGQNALQTYAHVLAQGA